LPANSDLHACIARALTSRKPLLEDAALNAYRLFHGASDGIDGLAIDQFGDVLVVQLYEGRLRAFPEAIRPAVQELHVHLGTRAVYRKFFVRDRAKPLKQIDLEHHCTEPWIGQAVESDLVVNEYGLKFVVHPYDGFSVGLFLEHRENRRRVRELATRRRVLNLFCYTCGFSVAAAAGGAASVASVDLSKRYLEWGKSNFAANGLNLSDRWFFCSDVFDFYKRARRQDRRFDLIVLDPPTFGRMRRPKRTFVLAEQIDDLCAGACELLDPGGIVLLAVNDQRLSRDRLEDGLISAAGSRGCEILERPMPPLDFCGDLDYSKTLIARFG
jgi:23S rRNA (cytosine1962-C5)-methyltransferase